jgi:hypothetical protein
MGRLGRVMVVLNEEDGGKSVWPKERRLDKVPSSARGTAHLIAQAVHELSSQSDLKVKLASLDAPDEGLATYLGTEDVVRLRRDISGEDVAAGIRGLAEAIDVLLVDISYRQDFSDRDALVKLTAMFAKGATSVGAEARAFLPHPLKVASVLPRIHQKNLGDEIASEIVAHHSCGKPEDITPGCSRFSTPFPAALTSLAYVHGRGASLGKAVAGLPRDERYPGLDSAILELWLNEAAQTDLMKWVFGKTITYRSH